MKISQATRNLAALGFKMNETGKWGSQPAEHFPTFKDHVLSTPFRDVYIGHVPKGWYITSHIHFHRRKYRARHSEPAQLLNIFGGGKTLSAAMTEFVLNFIHKRYNTTA